jgi:guanylate kinase
MTGAKGKLVIISGPAGAGKSTVVRRLVEQCDLPLTLSISATTRQPRPNEQDGVDYHFMTLSDFEQHHRQGDFLECKEVFGLGYWYGTLRSEVTTGLNAGKWVILEIDVEGALAALEHYPDAITIFLHTGSPEELERRLRGRKTESEESIQRRLSVAEKELDHIDRYRHEVVNHQVEKAVQDICDILTRYGDTTQCTKT